MLALDKVITAYNFFLRHTCMYGIYVHVYIASNS